jgi:hypothetical protein
MNYSQIVWDLKCIYAGPKCHTLVRPRKWWRMQISDIICFWGALIAQWSGFESWVSLGCFSFNVKSSCTKVRQTSYSYGDLSRKRIFKIGQCQLMVINNDNTNNGRYEKNHFRTVVLISQKKPWKIIEFSSKMVRFVFRLGTS